MFSVYSHEITIFLLMAFILFPNTIHTHTYTHTGNTYIHTHTLSLALLDVLHTYRYINRQIQALHSCLQRVLA